MNNINIINDSLYNKCKDVRKKVLRRFCAFDGIGADLTNCESYDEALEAAGLDYTAKKEKLFLENGTEIEGNFAVMKSDDPTKFLGIVGNQYTCVANRDAFSVAEELYKEGYMRYETGGPVLAARDKVDYSQAVLILRGDDFDVAGEPLNNSPFYAILLTALRASISRLSVSAYGARTWLPVIWAGRRTSSVSIFSIRERRKNAPREPTRWLLNAIKKSLLFRKRQRHSLARSLLGRSLNKPLFPPFSKK